MTEYASLVLKVDSTQAKGAAGDLDGLTAAGKKTESQFEGLKAGATAVGAAVAAAAVAVAGMTKASIDAADAASDNAQAAGTTTENYTRLAYAMRFGAGGAADLDGTMKFLNKSMFDAANGSKQAQAAFDALGIEYTNTDGTLRDSTEVMLDVSERFSTMEDGAAKSALAMDIFGKSGAEIIPFLNQGRDGISALTDQADRLGITLSGDVANAAGQFNDNIEMLKGAAQGFGNQVMKGLLPALNNLGNEMVATADNGDTMASAADGVVAILKGLVTVAVTASATINAIGNAIGGIAAATAAAISGDFRGAAEIVSGVYDDTVNIASNTMSRIDALWSNSASVVEAAEERKRTAIHATMAAAGGGKEGGKSGAATGEKNNFDFGAAGLNFNSLDAMAAEEEASAAAYTAARMERLNTQFMTEREAELLRYQQQLDDFAFYAEQKALAEDDVNRRIEEMQLVHGQNMSAIASKNGNTVLMTTLSGLQGIAGAFSSHSKTMFKVMKAASIVQGILSIKAGIANAMYLPFPANLAAAATVAAQGASMIADIRSLTDSGGGKGISAPSGGGGVSLPSMTGDSGIISQNAAPTRQQAVDIRLTGIRPDDMISGSYLQKIIEGIGETLSNNGGRIGNVELVTV